MSLATRLLCVACALAVIGAVWFGYDKAVVVDATGAIEDKSVSATEISTKALSSVVTKPAEQSQALAGVRLAETDNLTQLTSSACEALKQQIDSHPSSDEYQQFLQQLSSGLIDSYYEQLSMEELMAEAQAANVTAMRMLSRKYLWYAEFQSYDRPGKNQFSDGLKDRSALAQSRYWNEQAGLHGYGGAFLFFAHSYNIELSALRQQLADSPQNETELSEQIRELEYLMTAHLQLAFDVMPQLTDLLFPLQEIIQKMRELGVSNQSYDAQEFEQVYQSIYTQWREKRAQLGLAPQIEFAVSSGIRQLMKMEKQMSGCYH